MLNPDSDFVVSSTIAELFGESHPNEPFISLLDQEKLPPLTHEVHLLGGGGNESVASEPAKLNCEPTFSTDEQEGE